MRLAPQPDDLCRIDFYRRANRADAGKAGIGGGETDSQSRHSFGSTPRGSDTVEQRRQRLVALAPHRRVRLAATIPASCWHPGEDAWAHREDPRAQRPAGVDRTMARSTCTVTKAASYARPRASARR